MRESVLVPDSVRVEHEHLFCLHVAEDHIRVEHIDSPEKLARNDLRIDLLQVLDIHDDAADATVQIGLVENYLLCVGQELCVEGEIVYCCHHTGQSQARHDEGH